MTPATAPVVVIGELLVDIVHTPDGQHRRARRRLAGQRRPRARPARPRHLVRDPRRHRRPRHPLHASTSRPAGCGCCPAAPARPTRRRRPPPPSTSPAPPPTSSTCTGTCRASQLPEGTEPPAHRLDRHDAAPRRRRGHRRRAPRPRRRHGLVRPQHAAHDHGQRPTRCALGSRSSWPSPTSSSAPRTTSSGCMPGRSASQVMARWAALGAALTVVTLGPRRRHLARRLGRGGQRARARQRASSTPSVPATRSWPASSPGCSTTACSAAATARERLRAAGLAEVRPADRPRPGDERPHGPPRRRLRPDPGGDLMTEFRYEDLLPVGADETPYRLLTTEGVSVVDGPGGRTLPRRSSPRRCGCSPRPRCTTSRTTCAPATCSSSRNILDDPEASNNDKFVALDLLKNANIAAGGVLPMCQDTGTAIVMGKRGQHVLTRGRDEEAAQPRGLRRLHPAQPALLADGPGHDVGGAEHRLQPARADRALRRHRRRPRDTYKFLFMAKGGGSANKSLPVPGDQGDPQPRAR